MDILELIIKFRSRFIKFTNNQKIQLEKSEFKERIDRELNKNFGLCGLKLKFKEETGDINPRGIPTIYVPRKGLVWKKMKVVHTHQKKVINFCTIFLYFFFIKLVFILC